MLGVIDLEITAETLAEFNRLYETKKENHDFDADRLKRHLDAASKIVAAMPEWKRNVLKLSGQPTVSTPRKPVNHWEEPRGANHTHRREFAERKLVGRTVHVYKLGGVRPEDDPNTECYLPLPEYGICLMTFKSYSGVDPNIEAINKAGNV